MRRHLRWLMCGILVPATFGSVANAQNFLVDPLDTPVWPDVRETFYADGDVIFDDGVEVILPQDVEDSADVPLAIYLSPELGTVTEIMVVAENNPIQHIARLMPHRSIESLGLKIRLEMSTAVRAGVKTDDGVWHIGSQWVNVLTPGGCSVPGDWTVDSEGNRMLGDIAVRKYDRDGQERLKFRIVHPMDTGFAVGDDGDLIEAYYVEKVEVTDSDGVVMEVVTRAAMASDPIITVDMPELKQNVQVRARDNKGLEFESPAFEW